MSRRAHSFNAPAGFPTMLRFIARAARLCGVLSSRLEDVHRLGAHRLIEG